MRMVVKWLVMLPFIVRVSHVCAQGNLVPNGNFETYSSCPSGSSQLNLAVPWFNPNPPSSPDYYHFCATFNLVAVPNNVHGGQYPHSDSAYAGIISYFVGAREHIEIELSDTLKSGEEYCISYFVSLAGKSDFATMPPQMHISDTALHSTSWMEFSVVAQIIDTNIFSDTTIWLEVTGEYTAHGGERFITIGHFFDNANTQYDTIASNNNPVSYFYIDDVSIYNKYNAEAGPNSTTCRGDSVTLGIPADSGLVYTWTPSVAMNDSSRANPRVAPDSTTKYYLTITDPSGLYCPGQPFDSVTVIVDDCTLPPTFFIPTLLYGDEQFVISALPPNSRLTIFDTRGRFIYKNENYQNDFSVLELDAAMYVYELQLPDLTVLKGKFCVVR